MSHQTFQLPKLFASFFNLLPRSLKRTQSFVFFFDDGKLSCINYKSFSGWYWADRQEFLNLLKYQLKRLWPFI